jgi:hypothetical protein
VFDGLLNFFGSLGDLSAQLWEAIVFIWQTLVAVFELLVQILTAVWNFLLSALEAIVGFFKYLWDNFFKPILTKLGNALIHMHQWLEDHLGPLLRFLQKLRDWVRRYYNVYLRPFLTMIQRIRQFLVILRFLHIRIAAQLDSYLAQLQGRITLAFATVTGAINTLIDITNALSDPRYLLRKPVLLISLRRQIPALIHAVTGRPPGYWFPSPKGSKGGPWAPVPLNFLPTDPTMNPPTSTYLPGDDGVPDLSGFLDGLQFTEGSVDEVAMIDYFNNDLWPQPDCTDAAACQAQAILLLPIPGGTS